MVNTELYKELESVCKKHDLSVMGVIDMAMGHALSEGKVGYLGLGVTLGKWNTSVEAWGKDITYYYLLCSLRDLKGAEVLGVHGLSEDNAERLWRELLASTEPHPLCDRLLDILRQCDTFSTVMNISDTYRGTDEEDFAVISVKAYSHMLERIYAWVGSGTVYEQNYRFIVDLEPLIEGRVYEGCKDSKRYVSGVVRTKMGRVFQQSGERSVWELADLYLALFNKKGGIVHA